MPSSVLPPTTKSKFGLYKQALTALSQRTRTPLPSLILSFGILHELTAIVPVVGIFFAARGLGIGESVVRTLAIQHGTSSEGAFAARFRGSWAGECIREWMVEGEARAERVGRRYGWFGYEKGSKSPAVSHREQGERYAEAVLSGRIAGDVANAVAAYALTKALLPIRIGLSMYLAPPFSRTFIHPVISVFTRVIRRKAS